MKESVSIVVLDREDPTTLQNLKECLAEVDCEIVSCASEEALTSTIASSPVDVLVINLEKPFERSFRLLSDIQTKTRKTEVIFVALFDDETLGRGWKSFSAARMSSCQNPSSRKNSGIICDRRSRNVAPCRTDRYRWLDSARI